MNDNARTFDTTPEDLSELSCPHIEALGSRGSHVVYHTPELTLEKDPNSGLTMFNIGSVFKSHDSVLIGCGTPNVALSVYDKTEGTWKRMSAFMFYREEAHVAKLEELQAGVYFELRGLTQAVRDRLLTSMNEHAGERCPSCAHLNASILGECGFSLGGGRDITRVLRPSRLASNIWRHGLELDGKPVELRVVNTSKLEVGDHFVSVWRKEANSPVRLVGKMLKKKAAKVPTQPIPAQDTSAREHKWVGPPVTVWMNRPNAFGVYLSFLWGRHAEYKVCIPEMNVIPQLSEPLESFPGQLSFVSKLKKHFLFSRPVVAGINRIKNKGFDRYDNVPLDATLEMLSPVVDDQTDARVLWNFALLLAGDSYELRLTPIKNQDPLSRESNVRKFTNWVLAKHVVASDYHPRTVFAGEGWVYRSADRSQLTVCLSNNSGTYKPTVSQLETFGKMVESLGVAVKLFPHGN